MARTANTVSMTIYLPPDLQQSLKALAEEERRSVSGLVVEAIRARLAGARGAEPAPAAQAAHDADPGQAMAQLGRLSARWEARLDKAVGEALILKEALLLFVRVWLEHNPPLEPELEDSAAMSANARFERYLDLLAQGLRGGRSIGAQHSHIARAAEDEALIAALGEEGAP